MVDNFTHRRSPEAASLWGELSSILLNRLRVWSCTRPEEVAELALSTIRALVAQAPLPLRSLSHCFQRAFLQIEMYSPGFHRWLGDLRATLVNRGKRWSHERRGGVDRANHGGPCGLRVLREPERLSNLHELRGLGYPQAADGVRIDAWRKGSTRARQLTALIVNP